MKDNCDYMQSGNCALAEYLGEDGELPCETETGVEKSNTSAAQQVRECIPFDPHVPDLSDCEWNRRVRNKSSPPIHCSFRALPVYSSEHPTNKMYKVLFYTL